MRKVLGMVVVVFLAFLWLNDFTPNEGVGEIKEGVEEAIEDLQKEIK